MKVGQNVTLVKASMEFLAVIVAIADTGPSGFKSLDLAYTDDEGGSHLERGVVHERDMGRHTQFWREGNPRANQTATPTLAVPEPEPPAKAEKSTKK